MPNKIINGDCIDVMKTMPDNSVDAIVTDPPYDLVSINKRFGKSGSSPAQFGKDGSFARLSKGFMGKEWDGTGIAFKVVLWKEALRVLKQGGHLISFGGTRTYHRMTVAIEDAGFEIRDMLEWIYASGFPKSQNVGKAYDKKMGNEREDLGFREDFVKRVRKNGVESKDYIMAGGWKADPNQVGRITKGNSEWEGFGTALKPAHEPIVLARKPLSEKTIVENCIKHGTGALDIDGCRIPTNQPIQVNVDYKEDKQSEGWGTKKCKTELKEQGRFPANLLVTDDALNDGEITKSVGGDQRKRSNKNGVIDYNKSKKVLPLAPFGFGDKGSKSRYFDIDVWAEKHGLIQTPKASKSERNEGCEGVDNDRMNMYADKEGVMQLGGASLKDNKGQKTLQQDMMDTKKKVVSKKNNHPTVKPIHLMSWLVRLVSKEGDTVLDPFVGSGTTGVSCMKLNRNFIGIEKDEDYCKIAEARLKPFMEQEKLSGR